MSDPIRVRMYHAGFGDCFLLFLPTDDGTKTLLLDCGSLGGGPNPMEEVVARLLSDVRAEGGALPGDKTRIDVIVATHRHKDHIGEFAQDAWESVVAGEVWMPWTETPDGPALALRAKSDRLAEALAGALPADASPALRDLAANALANQKARDRLLALGSRAGAVPRWIACESAGTNPFSSPLLPGVEFFVLGPLRDERTFSDMDPPAAENFARRPLAATNSAGVATAGTGPFSSRWSLPPDSASVTLSLEEINELRRAVPDDLFELLAMNDSLINSTSVVLVLRIGGTHLLLPGDAQWSTWDAALHDPARTELLKKTNFYKVGHHGSENATPISFVEKILKDRRDCISMASWKTRSNWPRIPESHLIAGLKAVGPFADHASISSGTTFAKDPEGFYIEATIPVTPP